MGKYLMGGAIKHFRKQKKISQENLAAGIMDAASLSRIECGDAMPSKRHFEALFERLGVSLSGFNAIFLTDKLAKEQKMMDELSVYLTSRDTKEAEHMIAKLEMDEDFKREKLNVQFLLAAKAANAINMNEDPKVIFETLQAELEAIGFKLSESNIEIYLLTDIAFKMFNMLAILYFEQGEHNKAIAVWHGLKKNIEKNCVDVVEKGRRYPQVMTCLAKAFNALGHHRETIRICIEGKQVCLETGRLRGLPDLAMYEARSKYELGDKEACARLLRNIYCTLDLFERYEDKETTKKYAKEKLGIDL